MKKEKELIKTNFHSITLERLRVNVALQDVYGGDCFCSQDVEMYRKTMRVSTFIRNRAEYSDEMLFLDHVLENFRRLYGLDGIPQEKKTEAEMLLITLENLIRNL